MANTEYFENITEELLSFNLSDFLEVQKRIYRKFKLNAEGFELLDKYIIQTIEEISEVREAQLKDNNYTLVLGELIDVIMYLGSLHACLAGNYNDEYVFSKSRNTLDINELLDNVEGDLFNCRRMYPERKWHKKFDESDINQFRRPIFNQMIRDNIKKIIEYLCSNYHYTVVEEFINKKQSFIKNLEQ